MSQMDVIRAFLDGGELSEAALRTNGKQLFSAGRLIAEKRRGKVHVMEDAAGPVNPEHQALLMDFVEWREQRAKALRGLLNAREMLALARASGAQTFSASSKVIRPKGRT
jgi:hypothetical protein